MKTKTMKANKLAITVLALSLTQGVNATEDALQNESDNSGTYWGLGIGSVLGAVIGGPPGAALGATLGGSIGWGQDKDTALDQSLVVLDQHEMALEQSKSQLRKNRSILNKTRQKVSELSESNDLQAARLAELMVKDGSGEDGQKNTVLKGVIEHYAHEVYFRNGEFEVPAYAQARLNNLSEFLQSHPDLHVMLKGYTDHRGAAEFNATLAQARVDGIRDALLAQGIDAQRVTTQAIGEAESQGRIRDAGGDELVESDLEVSVVEASDAGNYVLDRRVSIELSLHEFEVQPIASVGEVYQ